MLPVTIKRQWYSNETVNYSVPYLTLVEIDIIPRYLPQFHCDLRNNVVHLKFLYFFHTSLV